jgi:YVTN family beta-propeller protein
MQSRNLNGSRSSRASCSAALSAMLAIAWAGEALAWTGQPLAYVTNSDGISVIDTGDNKVVDTIPIRTNAAVTPDGKRLYAFGPSTSDFVFNVSVINTSDDKIVVTVPLDVSLVASGVSLNTNSAAIAVTPDGKHVYAITGLCSSSSFDCFRPESVYFAVFVIDTVTNKVVATFAGKGIADGIAFTPDGQHTYLANFDPDIATPQVLVDLGSPILLPGEGHVYAIAITPDGKRAYVPYVFFNGTSSPPENVAVIDTATNTVSQTVPIETTTFTANLTGIAVMPDGKFVYVSNQGSNSVTVINTANNTIVKKILVGTSPSGLAITPDGVRVYVSNQGSDSVSVIDTVTNKVVATVPVSGPSAISIIAPPRGVGALAFNAYLNINLDRTPNQDAFDLESTFASTAGHEIHPDTEPVNLQVGPFIATIPAGSFVRHEDGTYLFEGFIDGVKLKAKIELTGGSHYAFFHAKTQGANLGGIRNPVQVSLGIGAIAGLTLAEADFD